jgi:hypothetical protein
MMAPKATPKPVQHVTRRKTSQTWFASQMGVRAVSMSARGRRPRSRPPATRSQKPAP